ncbi:MAG: hypothetical protein Kow0040_01880 [Thermogutta sp.]
MTRLRDRLDRLEELARRPADPDHVHVMNEGEPDPTENCELCKAGHIVLLIVQRIVYSGDGSKAITEMS